MRKYLLLICGALCASSVSATAVGWQTQMSCASDYYAFCSKFSVGTPELRKCMRANGPRLTKSCISALIADGEISKAEVAQQKEKIAAAKAKTKAASAQAVKPDPKPAAKIAAAPKPPDAKVAALEVPIEPRPKAEIAVLLLDQQTYAALKTREPLFVAIDEIGVTSAPALNESPLPRASGAVTAKPPEATPSTAPAPKDKALADARDAPPAKGAFRLEVRMSLGRNSPPPAQDLWTWWDNLMRKIIGGE